jgi:hypothetical protein
MSFSYTSQTIQTRERSAMVNRFGELSRVLTPENVDGRGGMIDVHSQHLEMLQGRLDIHFCLVVGVLRDLQVFGGDGSLVVQEFGAIELRARQSFVGLRLAVLGKGARNVRAVHPQQKLPLRDRVAQPRANVHHAPGGQRNHGHIPGYVGADNPGHVQFGRGHMRARRGQRKLLRMVHLDHVGILFPLDFGRGRRLGRRVRLPLRSTAAQEKTQRQREAGFHKNGVFHWIASRPTARFNWPAAVM